MNSDRLFQAGIGIALIGIAWSVWPHAAGGYYSPRNWPPPAYHHGPPILIDRGHWNESTADPDFYALTRLLTWDGYRVSTTRQEFVPELLQTAKVLVISDPLGLTGWLSRFGWRSRASAFDADELQAVREWVQAGGSLLLVADRPAAVDAARPLALALGAPLADRTLSAIGHGRVAVVTKQLADIHNHAVNGRETMLAIMHWLSRAE